MLRLKNISEEATSVSQQRLMGMALAYKRGELDADSMDAELVDKIKGIASGMTEDELSKFASVEHEGLPYKVGEAFLGVTVTKPVYLAKSGKDYSNNPYSQYRRVSENIPNYFVLRIYITNYADVLEAVGDALEIDINSMESVTTFRKKLVDMHPQIAKRIEEIGKDGLEVEITLDGDTTFKEELPERLKEIITSASENAMAVAESKNRRAVMTSSESLNEKWKKRGKLFEEGDVQVSYKKEKVGKKTVHVYIWDNAPESVNQLGCNVLKSMAVLPDATITAWTEILKQTAEQEQTA